MVLKGCYACIKYTVLIFNLLFWLAGLAILALSLWLYFDTSSYMQHVSPPEHYSTGLYLLIAVGAIMTVFGFLGCCGALRESQCMIFSYFLLVLLILIAQIVAVVWCVKQKDELKDIIRDSMKRTVQKEYGKPGQELRTEAFDTLQQELKCCGAISAQDWGGSEYNRGARVELGVTDSLTFSVPPSCCINPKMKDICDNSRRISPRSPPTLPNLYSEGCASKLETYLQTHFWTAAGIVIGIMSVEFLGLFFSIILCCAIRRMDYFKA